MNEKMSIMIFLLPVLLFYGTAFLARKIHNVSTVYSLLNSAGILSFFPLLLGVFQIMQQGSRTLELFLYNGLGVSLRIDPISMIMFGMVSIIAVLVLRFSKNYLEGDANQRVFLARFSFIVGSVQLLVVSGNLFVFFFAWVATSIGLQRLLTYNKERKKALHAARVKFVLARLADAALLSAFSIMYVVMKTGEIVVISQTVSSGVVLPHSTLVEVAAVLIAISAILKSVQFPFHTWLLGVLELPTPVSALLHAGLLNAGPFLIIRFAHLFNYTTSASTVLLVTGALSALYGTIVYTAQNSVKTGLVYSSVGHMGFSLMLCGLGVYSAALLHLVSHSFYKAHSFLRSGSVIEDLKGINRLNYRRSGNPFRFVLAMLGALGVFIVVQRILFLFHEVNEQIMFVGYLIFIGIMGLYIHAYDSENKLRSKVEILSYSVVILLLFYGLESLMHQLMFSELPATSALSEVNRLITIGLFGLFFFAVLFQAILTTQPYSTFGSALRVHVKHGFYIEHLFQGFSKKLLRWNVSELKPINKR